MLFALLVALATAPVSGRIADAESNRPIAGAHVLLIPIEQTLPPGASAPPEAITDESGRFVFDAVAPGQYRIDAQAAGFVPLAAAAPTVDTTAGQAIAGVELFLRRGAAITGRIVDAGGRALPWITVSALGRSADTSESRVTAMTQTDDLGEFQLAGLADGDYVVIAAPPPRPPFAQPAPAGAALSPTYYPGTTDRDAAQILSVASAQSVSDLQFSMVSTPAYELSGVVVDEAGSPVRAAIVMLMIDARSGGTRMPATGQSDENGMFRIGGVVPGTYQLVAGMQTMSTAPAGPGVAVGGPGVLPLVAAGMAAPPLEVTVGSGDVSGLKVVLTMQR